MGEIIRVAAKSQPRSVAASIANTIREHPCAEIQAIGVDALNQMVKAAIIARRYLVQDHFDLRIVPDYANVLIAMRPVSGLGKCRDTLLWCVDPNCLHPQYPQSS